VIASQPIPYPANATCQAWIRRLGLSRFRNYHQLDLTLDDRMVILVGPNGAGKTNIMEAVSLMAPGRGLRRAKRDQFMQNAKAAKPLVSDTAQSWRWAVSCEAVTELGAFRAGTGEDIQQENSRRVIRIDGETASQTALAERLAISWLTPDMDGILGGSPSERRRFLDRLVIAFDPAHAGRLSRYDRAMRQRNRLLEDRAEDRWLCAVEQELAETGVAIIAARQAMVDALDHEASIPVAGFPAARLAMTGTAESWLKDMPAVDVEDRILAAARHQRQNGEMNMPGAHNSLLEVQHSQTGQMAETSSTGEQKSLVISVILAHARLQNQRLSRPPVLLLDDIVSHLDAERRLALFELTAALPGQVWFSGTDSISFAPISRDANVIHLDKGQVV
jgi:DNA replication and repair protein RecF